MEHVIDESSFKGEDEHEVVKNDFLKLVERAKALDVYKPSWCPEVHFDLYKVCYLQVKDAPEAVGASATIRKKIVMKLMNTHITQARNALYDKAKIEHEKLEAKKKSEEITNEQSNT